MAARKLKTVNGMKAEYATERIRNMLAIRARVLNHVEDFHVAVQKGNKKTGEACYTVSLIPIVDYAECSRCGIYEGKVICYDVRNDCWRDTVQRDRARNSAIHKADRARYWREVEEQLRELFIEQLRINVGGDIDEEDVNYIVKLAKRNRKTDILFFTKNYVAVNNWMGKHHRIPKNVHCIFSAWPGVELVNPYNFPTSHLLWKDGTTTAPEFGAYYCGGNCTECHFKGEGCWTLKKGEAVIFPVH